MEQKYLENKAIVYLKEGGFVITNCTKTLIFKKHKYKNKCYPKNHPNYYKKK